MFFIGMVIIVDGFDDKTDWFYDPDTNNDEELEINDVLLIRKTNNDTLESIWPVSG